MMVVAKQLENDAKRRCINHSVRQRFREEECGGRDQGDERRTVCGTADWQVACALSNEVNALESRSRAAEPTDQLIIMIVVKMTPDWERRLMIMSVESAHMQFEPLRTAAEPHQDPVGEGCGNTCNDRGHPAIATKKQR
jgi:hypothetical protein